MLYSSVVYLFVSATLFSGGYGVRGASKVLV